MRGRADKAFGTVAGTMITLIVVNSVVACLPIERWSLATVGLAAYGSAVAALAGVWFVRGSGRWYWRAPIATFVHLTSVAAVCGIWSAAWILRDGWWYVVFRALGEHQLLVLAVAGIWRGVVRLHRVANPGRPWQVSLRWLLALTAAVAIAAAVCRWIIVAHSAGAISDEMWRELLYRGAILVSTLAIFSAGTIAARARGWFGRWLLPIVPATVIGSLLGKMLVLDGFSAVPLSFLLGQTALVVLVENVLRLRGATVFGRIEMAHHGGAEGTESEEDGRVFEDKGS
jgi:hypothetical protein